MPKLPNSSWNCKEGYHDACDGEAPKLEWNEPWRPCACKCHKPADEEIVWGERRGYKGSPAITDIG